MANRQSLQLLLTRVVLFLAISTTSAQNDASSVFPYVDPLIGTINGGHVFPGATLPFGMAKSVADTNSDDAQGGFASDDSESKSNTASFPDHQDHPLTVRYTFSNRVFANA